jgi:hypothetical protein
VWASRLAGNRHRDWAGVRASWPGRWTAGRLSQRDSLKVADGALAIAADGERRAWTSTAASLRAGLRWLVVVGRMTTRAVLLRRERLELFVYYKL